jgi:diguanylate cyclase (GGDEF)-like protein
MAICYLDLDGFKPINDTWGHEAGDRLLVEMAERLQSCLRGGDTVARLGGDEFVLLLLDLERIEECENALRRVLDAIAHPVVIGSQLVSVSASIGVSVYPFDSQDPDVLLRQADQAMYLAKESGRNRYRLFETKQHRSLNGANGASKAIEQASTTD